MSATETQARGSSMNRWIVEIDCNPNAAETERWGAEIRNPAGEVMPTIEAPTSEALCVLLAETLRQP